MPGFAHAEGQPVASAGDQQINDGVAGFQRDRGHGGRRIAPGALARNAMVEHAGGEGQLANIGSLELQGRVVAERLLQKGGGGLASAEGVVGDNPAQEVAVGGDTEDGGILQGPDEAAAEALIIRG